MSEQQQLSDMNRRDFLKVIARVSITGLAVAMLPQVSTGMQLDASLAGTEADVLGRRLRGTFDGLILESIDGGRTWQRIANFGKHCSVWAIREQHDQIYTRIGVKGYQFVLRSTDGRTWRTV